MDFTKEQLSEAFIKHLDRGKGLQDLMEHNRINHVTFNAPEVIPEHAVITLEMHDNRFYFTLIWIAMVFTQT